MIDVVVERTTEGLRELRAAWCNLAATAAATPFQTHQWASAWWDLVGSRDRTVDLYVVTVSVDGVLRGIAPLMRRSGEGEASLTFLSDPWADYLDVLLDQSVDREAVAAALVSSLEQEASRTSCRVELSELPPWSVLVSGPPPGWAVADASVCPRLSLVDDGTLAAALRNEDARKERRLERLGRLECRHYTDPDSIAAKMPEFMAMHLRQWVQQPNRGITFDDAEIIRFYLGCVPSLAAAGLVVLSDLMLDGVSIAFYFGFTFRGTFWAYRTAYDRTFRRFSPGHVLHRRLFLWLRAQGFTTFDFMRGDFAYKYEYASETLTNSRLVLERSRSEVSCDTAVP